MGREKKARRARREWRMTAEHLEREGVAERVRQATLGLRREEVQMEIHDQVTRQVSNLRERLSVVDVARAALAARGYDLAGVEIGASFAPSPRPDEPGRLVIGADVDAVTLQAARRAVGAAPLLGLAAVLN